MKVLFLPWNLIVITFNIVFDFKIFISFKVYVWKNNNHMKF